MIFNNKRIMYFLISLAALLIPEISFAISCSADGVAENIGAAPGLSATHPDNCNLTGGNFLSGAMCLIQGLMVHSLFNVYCSIVIAWTPIATAMFTLYVIFQGVKIIFAMDGGKDIRKVMHGILMFSIIYYLAVTPEYFYFWIFTQFLGFLDGFSSALVNAAATEEYSYKGAEAIKAGGSVFSLLDEMFEVVVGVDTAGGLITLALATFVEFSTLVFFGMIIMILAILIVVYSIIVFIRLVVAYITSLISLLFLMMFAPIFLTFAMLPVLKTLFRRWLAAIISYAMQPFLILIFIMVVAEALSFSVMAGDLLQEGGTPIIEYKDIGFTVPVVDWFIGIRNIPAYNGTVAEAMGGKFMVYLRIIAFIVVWYIIGTVSEACLRSVFPAIAEAISRWSDGTSRPGITTGAVGSSSVFSSTPIFKSAGAASKALGKGYVSWATRSSGEKQDSGPGIRGRIGNAASGVKGAAAGAAGAIAGSKAGRAAGFLGRKTGATGAAKVVGGAAKSTVTGAAGVTKKVADKTGITTLAGFGASVAKTIGKGAAKGTAKVAGAAKDVTTGIAKAPGKAIDAASKAPGAIKSAPGNLAGAAGDLAKSKLAGSSAGDLINKVKPGALTTSAEKTANVAAAAIAATVGSRTADRPISSSSLERKESGKIIADKGSLDKLELERMAEKKGISAERIALGAAMNDLLNDAIGELSPEARESLLELKGEEREKALKEALQNENPEAFGKLEEMRDEMAILSTSTAKQLLSEKSNSEKLDIKRAAKEAGISSEEYVLKEAKKSIMDQAKGKDLDAESARAIEALEAEIEVAKENREAGRSEASSFLERFQENFEKEMEASKNLANELSGDSDLDLSAENEKRLKEAQNALRESLKQMEEEKAIADKISAEEISTKAREAQELLNELEKLEKSDE